MDSREQVFNFTIKIEQIAANNNLSYMDAVIHYCESNNVEIETIAKLIQGTLKQKIKAEAEVLNFLPKSSTKGLPF